MVGTRWTTISRQGHILTYGRFAKDYILVQTVEGLPGKNPQKSNDELPILQLNVGPCDGEEMAIFEGKFKTTIREAAVHIKAKFWVDKNSEVSANTVSFFFFFVCAMLMSEKN